MTSNDSFQSQNRSEHGNQHLPATSIDPDTSGRHGLWTSETLSETSGFGLSAAIPVCIVPITQKDQNHLLKKKTFV